MGSFQASKSYQVRRNKKREKHLKEVKRTWALKQHMKEIK